MSSIWESYRRFDVIVGVCCKQIDEFKIGSHIKFNDLYKGETGSGTIYSFAQQGYEPVAWYTDDMTGDLKSVMLGWCRLE